MMKKKKNVFFSTRRRRRIFLWKSVYKKTDWETTLLGYHVELRWRLKVFLSLDFWISLHQGTLSILCFKIQGYMFSFMNKVDSCSLLPLCILYEIQNQIFQQLISERSSISCLYNMWLSSRIKENNFLGVFIFCSKFFA